MYTVITITSYDGNLQLECYGPFKSLKEANRQAEGIEYPCVTHIEMLCGNVLED
jgi:hypothetical protein